MSTRSSTRNLFPPLEDPERTIRRRTRVDPNSLNNFEEINMAANENGDDGLPHAGGGLPVPYLRTIEELCQPTLNGRGDDANKHLNKFLHVTQSMKVNGVSDDALRLYLFPYSFQHRAAEWFDHLPRNSITTFDQMAKIFLGKYFPPSMVTKLRNDITNFRQEPNESLFEAWERYKLSIDRCSNHNMLPVTQIYTFYNGLTLRHRDTINTAAGAQRSESSSSITSSNPEIAALKLEMAEINKNLMKMLQTNQQVNSVTPSCKTCGGSHSYINSPATVGQTQNVYAAGAYNQCGNTYQPQEYVGSIHENEYTASTSGSGTLPSNTITMPMEDLKSIITQSGVAYKGPAIPTTSSSPKVVERETEPVVAPIVEPVEVPVSAPKPNPKPSITYPSRLNDQKLREKANNQIEKFFQIFQDLHFDISFADALILMPKFASTIKSLLSNKEKLFELARTPLNEHCSAVLLKKLPEKLGDPDKFLIPCDFPGMDICLALADLGASINLMPLFVWKKLSIPELTPTFVDFDADPRVPLIIGRSFLKTGRALIDVYEEELTLCVGKEAVTFNLDQTSRYSASYNDMTANRIDVIDMACEGYSQEVLGFSDVIASGNPTPYYDLIVSTSSPTLTPFRDSDVILKEVDAFLALEDDPTSPEVDHSYYYSEGDILLLEAFLNDDTSLPPPTQGMYFLEIQKELKIYEAKNDKSSINEPPEVELKDLPPHLEYTFLEGDDKLPVIIAKDLSVEEKVALIMVLKSHKRAIAWKLSDIKGINPEFCTHKILMEEDYKPAVQHQRRVNPKIHDVIKKEVEKLLDAGLIYPVSDSPWVSPMHCVPEKGGFIVVENDENELIPTRLVTGWRVCIDYRKLNEATHKDHFPLPFMDQMLERLAGNEYYYFLDGFSGYFQIPIEERSPIVACLLGYVMHRARSKGV
ncbi:reverse transcriptase domain-containing protein [Tanacetum coccineum]